MLGTGEDGKSKAGLHGYKTAVTFWYAKTVSWRPIVRGLFHFVC